MPVRTRKFKPKGIARQLGNLCARLERASASASSTPRSAGQARGKSKSKSKSSRGRSTSSRSVAKARKTTSRSGTSRSTRDHRAFGATGRGTKRRRNADGTFVSSASRGTRDPAWFGEPRRHAKAAKKGIRNSPKRKAGIRRAAKKRRASSATGRSSRRDFGGTFLLGMRDLSRGTRDPAWFGEPRRHAKAAKKGIRNSTKRKAGIRRAAKKRSSSRRDYSATDRDLSRGTRDPAWFGQSERHAFAAEKGWRRVAKPGWTPKRYNPREDGSASRGPTRRASGGRRRDF